MPTPIQTPAPPAPVPPIAVEVQSTQAIQSQIAEISAQVAGYRAELSALQRQLRNGRTDIAGRPELASRVGELSARIARGESDIDRLANQLAQLRGVDRIQVRPSGQIIVNPPMARRGPDPDMVVGMSFVLAMCLVLPISIAIAKRIWRGRRDTSPIIEDRISPRLDRLEQAVDTIAVEIERISEGQRFVTRVLVERPAIQSKSPAGETPDVAGLNDPKPFLAIGAGPIEPIRKAERHAVRQSITPH